MSIEQSKKLLRRLGKKFAVLRKKSSKSLAEVSRGSDLSVYKLKKLEAGEYDIWLDELFALCAYYKVHPKDMV